MEELKFESLLKQKNLMFVCAEVTFGFLTSFEFPEVSECVASLRDRTAVESMLPQRTSGAIKLSSGLGRSKFFRMMLSLIERGNLRTGLVSSSLVASSPALEARRLRERIFGGDLFASASLFLIPFLFFTFFFGI